MIILSFGQGRYKCSQLMSDNLQIIIKNAQSSNSLGTHSQESWGGMYIRTQSVGRSKSFLKQKKIEELSVVIFMNKKEMVYFIFQLLLQFKYKRRQMSREYRSQLFNLKRQAYRSKMRRDFLQSHFKEIKQSFCRHQQEQQRATQRVTSLIAALPHSIVSLAEQASEYYSVVSTIVSERISQISRKMARVQINQWNHYIYVLCRVLVAPIEKVDLRKIIANTLLPVLECGEILANKYEQNQYYYQVVMKDCVDYAFRAGRYLIERNRLEQSAINTMLIRLWSNQFSGEQQQKLFILCNNLLTSHYDQDEQQNITPQRLQQIQLVKRSLVVEVFYKKPEIIRSLIAKCMDYSLNIEKQCFLYHALRLLINITIYVDNIIYYYPLLDSNILHIINVTLIYHRNNKEIMILTLRLLNNMLVNEVNLTETILKEVLLSNIVQLFDVYNYSFEIESELVELFINLIHFLNEDSQFIRELVAKGVHLKILNMIQSYSDLDENFVSQALSALIVSHNHHPIMVRQAFHHYSSILRRIADESIICEPLAKQALETVYDLQQHV